MKIPPKVKDIAVVVTFLIVTMTMIYACWWSWNQFKTTPPYVDEQKYPVRGIDISSHNGDIDFMKVKNSGYEFVFIKSTEGATFKDKNFEVNYQKALQSGIEIGAYHFFRYDVDGIEQAKNLCNSVDGKQLSMGVVIDVENYGNPEGVDRLLIRERLSAMADYLLLKGYRILFYSNKEGYYDHLNEAFNGYPLWICSFSEYPINAEWLFWQYNHKGKVSGIDGDVDLNAFNGSREDWQKWVSDIE